MLHGNGVGTSYAQETIARLRRPVPIVNRETGEVVYPSSTTDSRIQEKLLDMDTLAQAVLEAEGDTKLVAERLLGSKHKESELLALLSADGVAYSDFSTKARAFILIKLIQTFSILQKSVIANIGELEPKEAAKVLMKSAEMIIGITKQDTTNSQVGTQINVFDTVMKNAPAPVADILRRMIDQGGDVISLPAPADGQLPADAESDE